jgi:homocysteine S-methyltransferase
MTPLDQDKLPLIIDGGLSNVLEAQGINLNHHLWTARLLDQQPEAIIQAHLAYLQAGAQCITTASYQASFPGFAKAGYSYSKTRNLILKSVELAKTAVQQHLEIQPDANKPLIAASIGPYGAYLADGSEYRGYHDVDDPTLRSFHQERLHLLAHSDADWLACETIPDLQETRILAELLAQTNKPAWVSFSCKDSQHLNDGSPIQQAAACFRNHPSVFALGINCTRPEYVSGLIQNLQATGLQQQIIAYPNSGENYDSQSKNWQGGNQMPNFSEMARDWQQLGASLIGGCCRVGPEQIKDLASQIIH